MEGYLWMVSADGVPFRIPAVDDPSSALEVDWQPLPAPSLIRSLVATADAAFAIDQHGKVLVLVLPTHIARRHKVEVFYNQRWYPIVGWQRPLPTDRSQFSDESGAVSINTSNYGMDAGWSWEEPWMPQQDSRRFDKEGFEYSMGFSIEKWSNKCGRGDFVRRCILKRQMRYTATDQWVELTDSNCSRSFLELAVCPTSSDHHVLFALADDGNIYRRSGLKGKRLTSHWTVLPRISFAGSVVDDVTVLAASPSIPTLIAVAWDGTCFYRQGISTGQPSGLMWKLMERPRNLPVTYVAVGTSALWCVTADGRVWMSRLETNITKTEHVFASVTAESYQELARGICRLTLMPSDQLLCISNADESISVRSGISAREVSGRSFDRLVERLDSGPQRWIQVFAGACNLRTIPDYWTNRESLQVKNELCHFKKCDWRLQILKSLVEANERAWRAMSAVKGQANMDEDEADVQLSKQFSCQIYISADCSFKNTTVNITADYVETIVDGKPFVKASLKEVLCATPSFHRMPQKYLLVLILKSHNQIELQLAFPDETTRNLAQTSFEKVIRENLLSTTRDRLGQSLWVVAKDGSVRWHCLSELSPTASGEQVYVILENCKGLAVKGHFSTIDVGAQRCVWATTETGIIYVLDAYFDVLDEEGADSDSKTKQIDETTFEIFEYQKWAMFRGFCTFQGKWKGLSAWMDDNGPVPELYSSLPSRSWSWLDSQWRCVTEANHKDDGWVYASDANGPFKSESGNVRRRKWRRKAHFETVAPWTRIDAPPICYIRVAKQESLKGTTVVVALTKDGHLLLRHGVDRGTPQGTSWSQILTDEPVLCIHLNMAEQLWTITKDHRLLSIDFMATGTLPTSSTEWTECDVHSKTVSAILRANYGALGIAGRGKIIYVKCGETILRVDTASGTLSDPHVVPKLRRIFADAQGRILLLGECVTRVADWRVATYPDGQRTIIGIRQLERVQMKELRSASSF